MTHRPSGRNFDQLRAVSFECGFSKNAEGSCLIKMGNTHVLCTASFEENVPRWIKGSGSGWVTAEYGMLPRSTNQRMRREATAGKQSGRTQEIQRLIGRSLRAAVDLKKLGEKQITIDCDVIQADGGTRTASITGAWLALKGCIEWMHERDIVQMDALKTHIAAISCGVYKGEAVLDLDYAEDSDAEVDCNFVITGENALVEVQGSAEGKVFTKEEFDAMHALAAKGCGELINLQKFAG